MAIFYIFDEKAETIDTYVTHIRQVAALLGYGEPQILEVFKNILPTKLYWILFPIEDLRQVVEIAKRILTKEKLDRQLTGQSSSTPFMMLSKESIIWHKGRIRWQDRQVSSNDRQISNKR